MSIEELVLAFAAKLRSLRREAGFHTGKEFAEQLRWVASKVSRIENGRTLPTRDDLEAWCAAAGVLDRFDELHAELIRLRLERDRWKQQLRQGHAPVQKVTAQREHDSDRIVMVEFFLVPGLVQTPDYMRAVYTIAARMHGTPGDTEEAVAERVRRQEVLYDPSKTVEILVAEAALRYPVVPPAQMRVQLDRLWNLVGLGHVRFGIIPLGTVLPTITMHGYTIFDDTVLVEVNHTEITAADPDDVELYDHITSRLWEVAAEGDKARTLLRDVLDHYSAPAHAEPSKGLG
ncbi:helix-turn-helix domain-containing protein [Amycolatopsis thermoflava]|uniref:helix-turn-helix domain-containing protein n=1 Tax=Amycolatopsis thermoflava TaxID=84480 RepID=UPI003F49BE2E